MRTTIITCDNCEKVIVDKKPFARIGYGNEQDVPFFVAVVPGNSALPWHSHNEHEACSWECTCKILEDYIAGRAP